MPSLSVLLSLIACPPSRGVHRQPAAHRARGAASRHACLALLASALLAACGGGAGDREDDVQAAAVEEGRVQTLSARKTAGAPATSPTNTPINEVVLRASSVPVQGTGAVIQLRYRGNVFADVEVDSPTLADLRFRVGGSFDGSLLDIVFTNAGVPNTANWRKLTIEGIYINGTRFAPSAPGVVYDLGHGMGAFDGIDLRAGTNLLSEPGALRIPLPASSQIGSPSLGDASTLSATPGPYVDAWTGSDANPGTRARPYRTLSALTGRSLLAGENIHLRCGRLWRETLTLDVGELSDGTQIRRYGDDCSTSGNPVISGANVFSGGWTRDGLVWSRALPAGTPRISRLFVGHTPMRPAQWPNAGDPVALADGPVSAQPRRFRIGTAAAQALAGRNLAGATALIRTTAWKIETLKVDAQGMQGQEVALTAAPSYAVKAGDGYLFRDLAWMLDAPGEFFHDTATQRLYLIPGAADAGLDINATPIEGSVRDLAIDLRSRKQLAIRDIVVRNARQDGIRLTNTPEVVVSGVESRDNGATGIKLMQWTAVQARTAGPNVQNNLVSGNGEYGIDTTFVKNAIVSNNRVVDTGLGTHTEGTFAAISAGPGARVEDNEVDGSGYAGIMFSGLDGSVVARNEVSRYCVRLSDCGGLYTWTDRSSISPQQNSTVENNRLYGATAAIEGSRASGFDLVAGVYLDEFTQGAKVRRNFVHGVPVGVLLHNAARTTVEGNRIWLAKLSALWVNMSRLDGDWSTGNLLQNNEIVPMVRATGAWPNLPKFEISHPVWFSHYLAGAAALGAGRNDFIGNRVVQVNGVLTAHARITGPDGQRVVDAAGWRELNTGENLPERPITFSSYFLLLGPEKVAGGHFQDGLAPWQRHWNWQLPNSINEVLPVQNQPGCTGPCIRMRVAEIGESIFSPSFSMNPGVPHLYRWTATATQSRAVVGDPYISLATTPWSMVNDSNGFVTLNGREVRAGETLRYEAFFVPSTVAAARVNLQLQTAGVPVHFDDVSVRQINGWWLSGPT